MSNSLHFLPQGANVTVTASTTTASGTWSGADKNTDSLRITNPTNGVAFVRIGVGAQTAVLGDFGVQAGQTACMRCRPGDDTVAVILNTGATTGPVYFQRGDGWS